MKLLKDLDEKSELSLSVKGVAPLLFLAIVTVPGAAILLLYVGILLSQVRH